MQNSTTIEFYSRKYMTCGWNLKILKINEFRWISSRKSRSMNLSEASQVWCCLFTSQKSGSNLNWKLTIEKWYKMLTFRSGFLLRDLSMRFVGRNRIWSGPWYGVWSSKNFLSNFEKKNRLNLIRILVHWILIQKRVCEVQCHVFDLARNCNFGPCPLKWTKIAVSNNFKVDQNF